MTLHLFVLVLFISVTSGSYSENFTQSWAYDYDLYESVLDPELCQRQLNAMNAFEFYDASFRLPQGMLRGNVFSLGNYQQCLAINQPLQDDSIRGKYCIIQTDSLYIPVLSGSSWPGNVTWAERIIWSDQDLKAYKSAQEVAALNDEAYSRTSIIDVINTSPPLTLALCIPRSCRVEDVLNPLVSNIEFTFTYSEQFCRLPDDKPYSGADVASLVIFSVIGILTLMSTAYELNHIFVKKESSKPNELWSCFSVYGNTDRLLTIGSSRPGALDCLDGIRALSILWVMLGHSFLVHFGTYLSNGLDVAEWTANLKSVFITAANVTVDSFLVLSGLLLVYTTANKIKQKAGKKGKKGNPIFPAEWQSIDAFATNLCGIEIKKEDFAGLGLQVQLIKNLHLFYLNRLLRMLPLLAAAVLLLASTLHQVSDGVRWNRVAWETQKCRDHWWSALLHIQNLVNPRAMCLSHSWYLSVDVQLHILSPLLLFWVLGGRRSAWSVLATAVLSSITFVTIYCFIMEFTGEQDTKYTVYFYHNTLARSPVFIIGMLCGYVLHLSRDKRLIIPGWLVCCGHIAALVLSAYSVYHVHPAWDSQVWLNLNTALFRSAWAIALCWLIVACVHGYAGPIDWFLSIKLFKFLARISYAMYIFHYPMMFVTLGANNMPVYFSMEAAFANFASDVAYTVIVSMAACVLLDAPCATLIRKLLMVITPQKPHSKSAKKQGMPESKKPDVKSEETE